MEQYPRHVGDDELPLAALGEPPQLDGKLSDRCWSGASRGVVRVARLAGFERGPLVSYAVQAGVVQDQLYVALQADRWLSRHLATVVRGDGTALGLVVATDSGLALHRYRPDGELASSSSIDGAVDQQTGDCEFRLPLSLWPDWQQSGLWVGAGIGGHHTSFAGRGIRFRSAPWCLAEEGAYRDGAFRVRLVSYAAKPIPLRGNAAELANRFSLAPGQTVSLSLPADRGPIGPQRNLEIRGEHGEVFRFHLFRYDPLERALTLLDSMIARLAARGLEVGEEREQASRLALEHERLLRLESAIYRRSAQCWNRRGSPNGG